MGEAGNRALIVQSALEAAVTGDRVAARKALLANPLVGDYRVVGPLLEALLEASRPWLPRFFPGP